MTSSPTDSCRRTFFSMQRRSTRANDSALMSLPSKLSRASFHAAGRRRLPTTSVRMVLRSLKQRGPHQECLVALRVVGHRAQLGEALLALRRLALFETLLVGDGLFLHVLDVQRASDALVRV